MSNTQHINEDKVSEVLNILGTLYTDTRCELNYKSPFELLVATILAAQATDKKVNEVTEGLFRKFNTPQEFASLRVEELESEINKINLYKSKARYIINMCNALIKEYGGEVPETREELIKLAGVGRKTANVVLSYAFDIPAIAVDTHVHRVANRLGLVNTNNAAKTELELEKVIPKGSWSKAHSSLVLHGRRVCKARKPDCNNCRLNGLCKYHSVIMHKH